MFLFDVLSGLLRPALCLACGVSGGWPCCARCLPPDPGDIGPWPLAADPEVALWALGPYRDALRSAVLAGKLDGQPAALTALGRRLGTALAEAGVGADLVTYVAAARVAGPPRDHAERIATGVATALDLPLVDLLAPSGGPDLGQARASGRGSRDPRFARRASSTGSRSLDGVDPASAPGTRTPGFARRASDWAGRFLDGARRASSSESRWAAGQASFDDSGDGPGRPTSPPPRPPPTARQRLAGGRILLIDDLATTGGTLAGAAATLRLAGARQVEAAVLAVAPTALRVDRTHRLDPTEAPSLDPSRTRSLGRPERRSLGPPGGRVAGSPEGRAVGSHASRDAASPRRSRAPPPGPWLLATRSLGAPGPGPSAPSPSVHRPVPRARPLGHGPLAPGSPAPLPRASRPLGHGPFAPGSPSLVPGRPDPAPGLGSMPVGFSCGGALAGVS